MSRPIARAGANPRADRVAERRESPASYRIDGREAPLQRRVAWEEPGQGPGRPPGAPPLETASMDLETGIPGVRECERFVLPYLDGRTQTELVRAPI